MLQIKSSRTLVKFINWMHQAITWANVESDLYLHKAVLGHKE